MSDKVKENKNQIHYIYKIIFLCGYPCGRYYLGKRTYNGDDLTKDSYHGSGNFCKAYFKKYGIKEGITYIKQILEVNPSYEINKLREKIIIGDLWKTDLLCMNQKPGGDGGAIEGHIITKENIEKLKAANSVEVIQYDLNGKLLNIFNSIKEASESTGICAAKIASCANKSRFTCGNYIWRHLSDPLTKEELNKILKFRKIKTKSKRPVYRIDPITKQKTWYESVRAAARANNIQNSSIHATCSGKRCTAGGFEWKFDDVK